MNSISWQYIGIETKRVQIESVNTEFRDATVIDLDLELPFVIDIPKHYPISTIEPGKSYTAIVKVYKSDTILHSSLVDNGYRIKLFLNPRKYELVGLKVT